MADRGRRVALAAIALSFLFVAIPGLARAAMFTVTNTNDTGMGSLRDAITNANAAPTAVNTINFTVSGTITLGSLLPEIVNTSPGSLTIDGSGRAITVDGASMFEIFMVNSGATLNLRFLTLAHGLALSNEQGDGDGGAVFNDGGTLTVTNCTFLDNRAIGSDVEGSGFGAPGQGGAISNFGQLTVTDSTFTGNQAIGGAGVSPGVSGGGGEGGAIYNDGAMTVMGSTFSANMANGGVGDGASGGNGIGGAIDHTVGTVTIINSTFSANQVVGGSGIGGGDGDGGAIFSEAALTLTNATFSGNQATAGSGGNAKNFGGAVFNDGSTLSLKGTILASSNPANCTGTITDVGHNISDDDTCGFSGTSLNDSTTLHLDPAGLQNNGGPTNTIALEGNSEAVDFIPVASCTDQSSPTPMKLTTDQRGLPRPDPGNPGFCDAGAYELQTMPFVIVPKSERLQIVHSSVPSGNQLNTAFTFIENGFPTCGAANDAFNGFTMDLISGSCADLGGAILEISTGPFTVHTVNHQSYGTVFFAEPPVTLSIRMVELPLPAAPACGEWTINLELAGLDLTPLGNGPFALILKNSDGDQGCFDITNAIVGNQIPTPPSHSVRRGTRRR